MSDSFGDRLTAVQARIEQACARAGRKPEDVLLLPVTKGVDPDRVTEAAGHGLNVFAESKVQEARQKMEMCPGNLSWHLVGHLQSNKVKHAVRYFSMIHSIDSQALLQFVDQGCDQAGVNMPVCLEVNVSGEGSKYGLKPGEVEGVLLASQGLRRVEVKGLMTIPPAAEDPAAARPYFRGLRELRDRMRSATGIELPVLSMGMSDDFEVAIEEGSTMVRLGTILFGRREAVGK